MLLAIGAVVLLAAGGVLGGWLTGVNPAAPSPSVAAPQPTVAGLPPGREPQPPPDGSNRPAGPPVVRIAQPYGDGDTVFVVYGRGWPSGTRFTVALAGGRTSPIRPVADRAGSFNYAINQDHEFFPGPLPPGEHTVRVTAPGGRTEQVSFEVDP